MSNSRQNKQKGKYLEKLNRFSLNVLNFFISMPCYFDFVLALFSTETPRTSIPDLPNVSAALRSLVPRADSGSVQVLAFYMVIHPIKSRDLCYSFSAFLLTFKMKKYQLCKLVILECTS